jgi:hypothetical protein
VVCFQRQLKRQRTCMVLGRMATTGQTFTVHAYPVADSTVVRRNGVLYGNYPNERLEPRGLVVLPVVVRAEAEECVGLLRDISQTGMFFYCSLSPAVGSDIEVLIRPSVADPSVAVRCRCKVVRVETNLPGAATGVGVAIGEYLGEATQAEAADSTVFNS